MSEINPFTPADADRFAIWEMLVRRDSDFFLSSDWSVVAADYVETGFLKDEEEDRSPEESPRVALAARPNPHKFTRETRNFRIESPDHLIELPGTPPPVALL